MSPYPHNILIQRLYDEVFNRGEISVLDELFSPDFRDNSTPEQLPGVEGVKGYIHAVREGFPDIHVTIEDMVAEANKIAVRTRWQGTHLGTYEGIPATGKPVTRTMMQFFTIVDGKIAGEWVEGIGFVELLNR